MCRTVRTPIPCEPASVRTARDWLREQLAQLYTDLDADVVNDAALAISELVTNCVRADAHELTVAITAHASDLVVATTDDAPGIPQPKTPSHAVACGRGLQIVAALTTEWGVSPGAGHKTVWGRFALERAPVTTFACSR